MRLSEISRRSEDRVSGLEAKISEFSEMLGTAERLRSQDQQTIQKLRDRIIQVVISVHQKLLLGALMIHGCMSFYCAALGDIYLSVWHRSFPVDSPLFLHYVHCSCIMLLRNQ